MRQIGLRVGGLLGVLTFLACNGESCGKSFEDLALCVGTLPHPKIVAVVYDPTAVGTNVVRLDGVVRQYVRALVDRPGSLIGIWILDSTLGRIRELASYRFADNSRSPLARETDASRIAAALKDQYADSLALPLRTTRLVEGLGKVLRSARLSARGTDSGIEIAVLTDGLEEGTAFGSFECRALPDPDQFVEKVVSDGLITTSAVVPTRVVFAYVDVAPIDRDRCPLPGRRVVAVEALWRALFSHLGIEFEIFAGAPLTLGQATVTLNQSQPAH